MRSLDFSSWSGLLSTVLGLALITLLGVGIRLLVMQSVQQRRERENRQINERLRTLIAAYRTLGGSFTGDLAVDPAHLRDILSQRPGDSFDRPRRIRDAVEARGGGKSEGGDKDGGKSAGNKGLDAGAAAGAGVGMGVGLNLGSSSASHDQDEEARSED